MKTLDLKSLLIGVLLTMLIASFMLITTTDGAPRGWEYKKIVTPGIGITPELSKLGDEGWEVVGYAASKYPVPGHGNDESHFVLKRPKQRHWSWKFWK
jgi:hypothetical protein